MNSLQSGSAPEAHDTPSEAVTSARLWLSLVILLLATFMNLMDVTIVNVALPTLQKQLGATSTQIEWVVAGFVLSFALGLLPFGRMGDIYGRSSLFLVGVSVFTVASALCGLAPSMETLIAARVLQGIGGAIMMPQVMAIIQAAFPVEKRSAAFAMFGLSAGLAAVSGPVIGGLLIESDFQGWGWRLIFMVNVPVGILVVLCGLMVLPGRPGNPELSTDWTGILLSIAGLLCVIFPLIEGRNYDWPLWGYAMMAASVVCFGLFYLWQNRQAKQGGAELLPVNLLTNRNFIIGVAVVTFFFSGLPGFFMSFALYLQLGFGFSPLESGLTTIPFPTGILVATVISGALGSHMLKLRLITGMLILITGMALLRYSVENIVIPLQGSQFAPFLGIAGFGMGTAIAAMFQTVLSGVPNRDAGSGAGALQALQQVGAALGVALVGQVFFSTLASHSVSSPPGQAGFTAAMSNSIIYEFVVFSIVIVLALFLRPGQSVQREQAVPA